MRKWLGRPRRSNCCLYVLTLFVRQRLSGLVLAKVNGNLFPHIMGVTRRGHFIHLKGAPPNDLCYPLLFVGRPEVIHRNHRRRTWWLLMWRNVSVARKDKYELV